MQVVRETISAGRCLLNLSARSMDAIIDQMVDFLVQTGSLPPDQRQTVADGLKACEAAAPTVIGHACAVPHYYDEQLAEPLMVFARLSHPVNLGAPDGVATRFVFLLLGPKGRAIEHLDTLAAIARLMSDDEFHYDAARSITQQRLLDAVQRYQVRTKSLTQALVPPTEAPPEAVDFRPFAGLIKDLRRRLPHYVDDLKSGFQSKCAASIFFLFFACLAPAITFGGIMGLATDGQIGPVEMLLASAVCGIIYSLFSGQPLIILGGIGPLLIFTIILHGLCQDFGLGDQFLTVYAWVGLWTALFTIAMAVTNASNLMRYFTRFTDEIFSALMSLIFIYEAVKALIKIFENSFNEPGSSHDGAFLALILALGTFYVATSLSRFRRSHFLTQWMREFLSDFGPSIALTSMAVVAWVLRNEVKLETLSVGSGGFGTTSGRPWLVDLTGVSTWVMFAAAGPAALASMLVFLSQNITARLVNSPNNKLKKGDSYHLDLAVVGGLIGGCSLLGFPWLVAATVRSLAHVRALADVEEVVEPNGASSERIIHVNENRITALAIHLMMVATLFCLPLLELVPMATLYGIFLYMGVVSFQGNQLMERMSLWLMDSSLYPATHYTRRVPIKAIHLYTLLQFLCLAALCAINISPYPPMRILFPVFIALLVPVRWLASRMFQPDHLAILDADEEPDEEESHWV